MTKSFRGLSSRNFTTTNTVEEAFVGREAIAALRVSTLSPADASLGDSSSFSADLIVIDDDSDYEFLVLECLEPKDMLIQFRAGSGSSIAASPTPGLEIGDEGAFGVAVGGSASGVIDTDGDTDDITVYLVSGQTYLVSLRGTGANPLSDSLLTLFAPDGITQVAADDDGGTRTNSLLTYTATTTGQHVIRAASFNNGANDVGSYTVNVEVQGVDGIGFTNATSVPLALGTTFGFREFGTGNQSPIPGVLDGDTDRYSVTLEAGHFYTFEVAAGWDGGASGSGAMNTLIVLRNAAGSIVNSGTAQNDNLGADLSSALGFTATVSGTYYLDVHARNGQVGGYVIDFKDVDYSGLSPLDAINWIDADEIDTVDVAGVPTAYVYFGAAGEDFGEGWPLAEGWNATEKAAIMQALLEFTKITGIQYVETLIEADAEFRLNTIEDAAAPFGAYFYPQDPGFGTQQGIGIFNKISGGWNIEPSPGVQPSLEKGGFSFAVILHEFGHGHGLAHAHDTGGSSEIMPGVFTTSGNGTFSVYNMNQGVYTVMSYNDAWRFHPDGNSPFTVAGIDNGWSGSLSAIDIAILQDRYGVHDYNTGDNTYSLTDVVDDAFYECIWDSGGTDAIAYAGALNTFVDLTAATLDYSPTGGGVMSFLDAGPGAQLLRGGYTIANGAVIENASTGSGNDQLVGNSAANDLSGNGGADTFRGQGGDDAIHGGGGSDTAFYAGPQADYTVGIVLTNGVITGFTVRDDNTANGDEGTDTLDGVESISFAGPTSIALAGTVAVFDGDGSLVSMHSTIQAAIDAATTQNGYTIFASAGTYVENINVTKDLTIQGANNGIAGDGARGAETILSGSATIASTGVTIDGFQIVGDSAGPLGSTGVIVNSAADDFSLLYSVLSSDSAADFAIFVGLVTGLDVGNNLIEDYSIGMYIAGGNTSGSVHDNLFQGDGGPFTGLGNGVNSETSLVTIENNTFDGLYSGSLNLFPFGPNPVDLLDYIIGNFITNSGPARPVQIYPTALSTDILGTDYNEAFNGDIAGLPSGTALSFDGRGGDDHIYGFDAGDDLSGGDGADRIFAQAGDDTLNGGAGNDLLDGEGGIDTAEFADAEVAYTDTAIGWLVVSSEGNDFLQNVEIVDDGVGGRNLLVGSTGFAGVQAAFDEAEDGDFVRLATGTYAGTFNYSDTGLTVVAQPNAQINATFLPSGTQGITILGANLNDTITTGAGNDVINGGGGADTSAGGAGDDSYFVDSLGDVVIEAADEGYDIVYAAASYILSAGAAVEVLGTVDNFATTSINLTGNEFANFVTGNAGSNTLDGGTGADVLWGRDGDDSYFVDSDDVVVEYAGDGYDIVYARSSHVLQPGFEIEVLGTVDNSATTAINLTGNELSNYVTGNAGANVIDGGAGADYLEGRGGADSFAFTTALGGGNVDEIADFLSGTDTIALDDAIFAGIGSAGSFDANAFRAGAAALDADDRIIYNQATGQLFYDADGNGAGAQVLFGLVAGLPILTASDFQVI